MGNAAGMDVVQAEDLMALGVVWIVSPTVPVDIGAGRKG